MIDLIKITVKKDATIKETMRAIDQGAIKIALIEDENDKLFGIVSDGDIRRTILDGIDIHEPISKIANKNPIILQEGLEKETIMNQLGIIEKGFPKFESVKIPVVDKNKKIKNLAIYSMNTGELKFIKETKSIKREDVRKVLIIGGAGYLGSVLCRKLLNKGYKVRVLDLLMFGEEPILEIKDNPNFELIHGDIRDISTLTHALDGVDAVIHLAAIVGDPASRKQPIDTIETNYLATMNLAHACKYHQINRLIFASTCSVYGLGNGKLDENSKLNPVSLYARSKIESEKGILSLVDENFSPTIFRMGTLYGLSPRMRFDLVVNVFGMNASTEKKITVFGGDQWRPLLNVEDAAEAYIKCLEAPIEKIKGEIFNVGSDEQNYQIKDLVNFVKAVLTETEVITTDKEIVQGQMDKRDYNVSFDKIKSLLGFEVKHSVKQSILDIHNAIISGRIKNVKDSKYYNSE